MVDYVKEIAKAGLGIGAIELNPDNPFEWASGFRMPIYNDNRRFLFFPGLRRLTTDAFEQLIREKDIPYDIIAGTSTAGISPGTSLANKLNAPFIYIRDKPKDHGLRNQIEGIGANENLEGRTVLVVEDLISTGGSSARAVQAVRDAKGVANFCVSIFTYGLDKADQAFAALDPRCKTKSVLSYGTLLQVAKETGHLTEEQFKLLEEWRSDPFGWGEKHGFPKVEKGGKK